MSFISEVEASIRVLFDNIAAGFRLDPGAGHAQIDNWLQHLRAVDQPALRPIVAELEILRGHINSNNAAGMAQAFQNLGELTAQSALSVHNFSGNGDMKFSPEFRYTRWSKEVQRLPRNPNQVEFLFGISF